VTDCLLHEILDISPQGMISVYIDRCGDAKFGCPNDLIFDKAGNLYFTDSGSWSPEPESRSGGVFMISGNREVSIVATGLAFANGIALSEDESELLVAETITKRILRIDLGKKGRPEVFAQMYGGVGPDGIAFGADGNLYVAHVGKGVVAVVDPNGRIVAELPAGGMNPTNLAFKNTSLFVTEAETGSVQRLDINVRGIPMFGQRIRPSFG
jgi:gluconolactonase